MKKLLLGVAILTPLASYAACKHIEYAELKAMPPLTLALEYCDAARDTKIAEGSKPIMIGLHKTDVDYYGVDSRQANASMAKVEKNNAEADACQSETSRIYKMLMSKKLKKDDRDLVEKCKEGLPY